MNALYIISDSPITKAVSFLARKVVLNPVITGALLLALSQDATREHVLDLIRRADIDEAVAKKALEVLLGLGIVRYLNNKLGEVSHNSYRLGAAPGWNWPAEIAVVTGGSSGIGLGIVERFAAKSIKVAVLDVQELPKQLASNPYVSFYKCDVTMPESVTKAADAVRRDLGDPSILINNAGVTRPASILDIPHDFLEKIFAVNTISHWTTVKQFAPAMIKANKGHIVTVASVASFVALPGGADYSSTKASALAFHEALAAELKIVYKAPGVMTSIIHPNFVSTPLLDGFKDQLAAGGVTFLTVDRVADEITAQVFKCKGAQVVIPGFSAGLSGMRGWPTWLQVFIRDAAGKGASKASIRN